MKKSVALAAYNGEKYIAEQIKSILDSLDENDEIIISDDNPEGKTKSVIDTIPDPRIVYIEGPKKGVIKNFENAIKHCTGDVIFLSDQDDIWLPEKVPMVMEKIFGGADLVVHNADITDENMEFVCTTFQARGFTRGYYQNILRNSYMGCCMAFKKEILPFVLPFPDKIPMHDQWIALIAEEYLNIEVIDIPLIKYRRHSENVTGGATTIYQKLSWRINLIKELKKHRKKFEV